MFLKYFEIAALSALLSFVFSFLLNKAFIKANLVKDKVPSSVGGIGIWLAFLAVAWMYGGRGIISKPEIKAVLFCSSLIFIFGVFDDFKEVSISVKFAGQLMISALLAGLGVGAGLPDAPGIIKRVITVLWVIGVTNAFNHMDILDGLAGVLSLVSALALFLFTAFIPDLTLGIICLSISGAILGFLLHNLPPAKVYLGNAGSHFLGFILAAVILCVNYSHFGSGKTILLSPVLFLGVPILDTLILIFLRFKKGKLPILKSNDHIALIMRLKGFSDHRILTVMAIVHVAFCACGIALAYVSRG